MNTIISIGFYQVASKAIDEFKGDFIFTHFDIRDYEKPLRNSDKTDDNKLIALYKLLAPEHLRKLPFANDSNSLDRTFYAELLHIIGLMEAKDGSKSDIIPLEKEIDQLVYELYGLTEEEIAIVENS